MAGHWAAQPIAWLLQRRNEWLDGVEVATLDLSGTNQSFFDETVRKAASGSGGRLRRTACLHSSRGTLMGVTKESVAVDPARAYRRVILGTIVSTHLASLGCQARKTVSTVPQRRMHRRER